MKKKLFLMLLEIALLGITAKYLSPYLMITAFDLIICFTLIKVIDIQHQLLER